MSSHASFDKWKKLGETKRRTDAEGKYTFTVPPEQAAEGYLYIESTVEPRTTYVTMARYSFGMLRENEKLGERPFFGNLGLEPAEKISGTIVTPEGKPAAGVMVRAFSTPGKKLGA